MRVTGNDINEVTLKAAPLLIPKVKVSVVKLNEDAVIPTYGTAGAAGFDFYSVDDYVVKPGETLIVKTGLAMSVPAGTYLAVVPRSGVSFKTKIRVSNSPGTVDSDFTGEVGILVDNTGTEDFVIEKGYRIAQGLILPYFQANFDIVDSLDETERGAGGFGSTGVK